MKAFDNHSGDFQRRLTMYLDGALSREESRDFLTNIKNSPEQFSKLKKEQSFRDFLRTKVSRRTVSPAVINRIKSQIKTTS